MFYISLWYGIHKFSLKEKLYKAEDNELINGKDRETRIKTQFIQEDIGTKFLFSISRSSSLSKNITFIIHFAMMWGQGSRRKTSANSRSPALSRCFAIKSHRKDYHPSRTVERLQCIYLAHERSLMRFTRRSAGAPPLLFSVELLIAGEPVPGCRSG